MDGIARIPLIDYSVVDGVERDGCAPGEAEFIPKTVQYIAIINGGVQSNNTKGRQNPYVAFIDIEFFPRPDDCR